MKIILLMNLSGAVEGKRGNIKNVSDETGQMLITFHLAIPYVEVKKPRRPPIIVHTRCIKEQK